jgi:hypothetical protein
MTHLNVSGAVFGGISGFIAFWWVASLFWKGRSFMPWFLALLFCGIAAGGAVLSVYAIHLPRVLKEGAAAPDVFDIFGFAASIAFVAAGPLAVTLSACLQLLRRPDGLCFFAGIFSATISFAGLCALAAHIVPGHHGEEWFDNILPFGLARDPILLLAVSIAAGALTWVLFTMSKKP